MKNVLILAYDFKPFNTISANRTNSWFKYFKSQGIYPIVLTRKWNNEINCANDYLINEKGKLSKEINKNGIIYRAPFKRTFFENLNYKLSINKFYILRKILTFLLLLFKHLPCLTLEKSFYSKYAKQVFLENKIDFIIASGEPFLLFKYAYEFSKKYKVPYAIDYRDSWSFNPIASHNFLFKLIYKINKKNEIKYLRHANFFTTVSKTIALEIINNLHKKNYLVVENGYDKKIFDNIKTTKSYKYFTLVYTGSIYEKQPVLTFLNGLEKFIKNSKKSFKIIFVGVLFRPNSMTLEIEKLQKKYPSNIKILNRKGLKDTIKIQKKSSALLKLSVAAPINGFYGGKLYEYYACSKPILSVVHNKSNCKTDFFPNNKIQKFAYTLEGVYSILKTLQNDFYENKKNFTELTEKEKKEFSREEMTIKLSHRILKEIKMEKYCK